MVGFFSPLLSKALNENKILKLYDETYWRKFLINQPCDVIKMREMSGEVRKKTHKKKMDNVSFL